MVRICVFGDSIALGKWDDVGGWTQRLGQFLESKKDLSNPKERLFYIVYNLSISGNTSKDLLKRFKNEAEARNPDTIIFAIGKNDCLCDSKDKSLVSKKEFGKNIKSLLEQAKKLTDKIIFIGVGKIDESKTNPILWDENLSLNNKLIEDYNFILESVCKSSKVYFIPIFELIKKEDLEDGMHPNKEGHKKIFKEVKDFLIKKEVIK